LPGYVTKTIETRTLVLARNETEVTTDLPVLTEPPGIIDVGHHNLSGTWANSGNRPEQVDTGVIAGDRIQFPFHALDLGVAGHYIIQQKISLQARMRSWKLNRQQPGSTLRCPQSSGRRCLHAVAAK
jgi:hypothetical protein